VVAVVPPDDPELTEFLAAGGAEVVVNPDPARGLGRSLALGVAAAGDADGWLLALGDMPFIRPATVAAVAAALARGAPIAAPVHAGRRGHPVGFARAMGDRLRALDGDVGARALLEEDPRRVVPVAVDDPGIHRDVDRPHDL
jgi:molybdenum cofactor cytidylyltransferase